MTAQPRAAIPSPGPPPQLRLPPLAETTLGNGLRVLVAALPGVPMVQLRLRVPLPPAAAADPAALQLMADALLSGTSARSDADLAAALQTLGARLSVSADPDQLALSGSGLADEFPRLLDLLAEVLLDAAYPAQVVEGKRRRLVERLVIQRSRPGTIARANVLARLHGAHPYARELPEPDEVAGLDPAVLRPLHDQRVIPDGSVLVVVGDVDPDGALGEVARALGDWSGAPPDRDLVPPFPTPTPGPATIVDRPGAVQTNVRLAGLGVNRGAESFPALQLAMMAFGGYFSSRLVTNLRERHGYAYTPRAWMEHQRAGARLLVAADVGTEVTQPALRELHGELERLVADPLEPAELGAAQRYSVGSLALGTASQAGLASVLAQLSAEGLGGAYLGGYAAAMAAVTADDALAAARMHMGPAALVTVQVGDAARIADGKGRAQAHHGR